MNSIEVDRTRVRPLVKITGEFWAQITEGDGNFHMFDFLEREGAQVLVEPIATWVAYLMYQAKAHAIAKWPVNQPHKNPEWYEFKKQFANYIGLHKKLWGIGAGERMWNFFYHRTAKQLGGITHHLAPQTELAELANPFYNQFARGGEGHLEVGKNVYYTIHKLCHMVLALKPFGCMPSSQSDGVQSAVINKFKDMIFLPIETSGEGEVNAHSRVQMALGEAKVKAKAEFEQCLKSTGKTMAQIREYIDEHPELKRPFYQVPHREGVAGTAAQFVLHVSDRIDKDTRFWKRSRVRVNETAPAMSGD
jgi:predicted nucleotide-binding protein (sugar kinase/HSP70/actin superfamily)